MGSLWCSVTMTIHVVAAGQLLYLEVSALHCLCLHQQLVSQGGLPMVNVSYDGEVPDVFG